MPPLVPVTNGEILLELAQEMALKITTVFEGGKSMNYQALADDTDYQATSFGLIQWNFGQGTLGPLLKKMLNQDPTAFAGCFSAGADYDTLKKAINDGKIDDQTKWARKLLASSKGKAAWKSAFESLGKVAAFNKIQREQAAANYHPSVVSCVAKLRSLDSKLMQDVSFRTYAALFDLSVQQGDLKKAAEQIDAAFVTEKPKTQAALVRLAVVERAKAANPIYVADCISRRCGILDGACFESTENKMTAKRENSQLTLIVDFGECRVCDL